MKIKNENKSKFLELSGYIYDGEYQKIDEWFEKNKVSKNQELENYIISEIRNHDLFIDLRGTIKYDERIKREIAILKNLSFDNQMIILFNAITKATSDHFKVIKLTPENKKFLEYNKNIVFLITERFATEEFTEIDKIQKILGFNVMEQKTKTVKFCYEIEHSDSDSYAYSVHLSINKPIFSPKCDIIFNYSEEKRKFLEERNIALPMTEETNSLYLEIKEALKKTLYMQHIEKKLDESFKKYEVIQLNMNLKNELQIKNSTEKKKVKI